MPAAKTRIRLDGADPINRDLMGWWPMDEHGRSPIARDISPYRRHGVAAGSVPPIRFTGPMGRAAKADPGTYGYYSVANFAWPANSPITVAFWAAPQTTENGIFSIGPNEDASSWLSFFGTTYWDYPNSGARISTTRLYTNQWSLVCMLGDNTGYRAIAFNGKIATSTSSAGSTPGALTGLNIGANVFPAAQNQDGFNNFRIWKRRLRPSELLRLYQEPWAGSARRRDPVTYVAVTGYTLTAASGSFTVSGQSVNLRAARLLTAASGSLALSGQDVALKAARRILIDYGSLTLSGQNVTLTRARLPLVADAGTFTVTGQDVALKAGFLLSATTAFYTVTGRDATLTYSGEVAAPPSGGGARRARKGFRRIRLPVEEPTVAYEASSIPPELKAQAKKAWQDDDDEWILLA